MKKQCIVSYILLFGLFLVLMVGLMTSCKNSQVLNKSGQLVDTSKDLKSSGEIAKKPKIALIMKTLTNPFFVEMEKGARKAESEFNIELIVKTGAKETSIQQQIAIVEEMIADKVDAIVIAPGSSTELIPVLKKAQDAKILIVNIDNRLDKDLSAKMNLANVPFISVNNEIGAYNCAKRLIESINKPTKAVIIEGIRLTENGEQRKAGAVRAFAENKNISVVASETANWKIDEANVVLENMLQKDKDIRVVFCANDMMALGAIQYLQKNNKATILVGGFDALPEAQKAILDGTMVVTIDQQADLQGYTGIEYAIKLINKQNVPSETMLDTKTIDKSTLK